MLRPLREFILSNLSSKALAIVGHLDAMTIATASGRRLGDFVADVTLESI